MNVRQTLKTVVVVDDHDLIRLGICRLLADVPNTTVIGQASSGEEAISIVRELTPDIVFMDIRMPGMGGLEATQRILSRYPDIKIIVVSAFNDDVYPATLLKAGASGYITKNADTEEIKTAVQTVLSGNIYVSPKLAQMLVISGLSKQSQSPLSQLSKRELQIAELITSGKRANDAAEILNISPKTISTYKYRLYEKLGVTNDVELTLVAVKYGLVDPSEIV
ncbi:MAG: DNA-binding response regulator [Porticoccaceae bacterium]|nr:MAG: DNA-binding response regulator [Porticoccaceae bacterium]